MVSTPNILNLKERIDELEVAMGEHPLKKDGTWRHVFTPGLYTRTILLEAGDRAISKIHRTKHQFILVLGVVSVWVEGKGWELYEAPMFGITEPGTRRIMIAHSDVLWTTIHATEVCPENDSEEAVLEAVRKIEEQIIEPNPEVIELKEKRRALCHTQQ
jgi:hypothetical protein